MAGFLSKVTRLANSPKGRRAIEQARAKAEQLSKDPATRAKIDKGVDRVRSEVDKRRGGQGGAASQGGGATPAPPTQPPPPTPPAQPPQPPPAAGP